MGSENLKTALESLEPLTPSKDWRCRSRVQTRIFTVGILVGLFIKLLDDGIVILVALIFLIYFHLFFHRHDVSFHFALFVLLLLLHLDAHRRTLRRAYQYRAV